MIDLGSRYAGTRGPFRSALIFLFHLAWKSRVSLPVLIAVGFMVLDIRMRLEINIDLTRGGRQGITLVGEGAVEDVDSDDSEDTLTADEIDDSVSYTTGIYSINSTHNSDYEDIEEFEYNVSGDVDHSSREDLS